MTRSPAKSSAKAKQSEKSVLVIIALLHKWGIHTFGEFSRLDKEDIRTRLGREAVRLWERAQGKAMRLLKLVESPESFIESFEFEYELEAQPTKPLPQQFGLFEASLRNPNQLYETLARLTALLGNDRVGTPMLEDTYRPDAFRIEPFSWELPESLPLTQPPTGAALRKF